VGLKLQSLMIFIAGIAERRSGPQLIPVSSSAGVGVFSDRRRQTGRSFMITVTKPMFVEMDAPCQPQHWIVCNIQHERRSMTLFSSSL
jgi:hypothetical protein